MIFNKYDLSEKLNELKSIGNAKIGDDLQGVLYKNGLLVANNLITQMVVPVTPLKDEQAEFIIPATAIDYINKLPEGRVELIFENGTLSVKGGKAKSRFTTRKAEDYPDTSTEKPKDEHYLCTVNSNQLEKAVKQVAFACSKSDSKPVFQGILFDGKNGNINIVTCDGARIAWAKIQTSTPEFKAVITKEGLLKTLSLADENVALYKVDGKTITFITGEYQITTKLHEAESFIDYEKVFNSESSITFSVSRDLMLSSLSRIELCIEKTNKNPAVLELAEQGLLKISGADVKAKAEETVEIVKDTSEQKIRIGVNAAYLSDALKAADDDTVVINMDGAVKPIIVTDKSLQQLVLPMRLKGQK